MNLFRSLKKPFSCPRKALHTALFYSSKQAVIALAPSGFSNVGRQGRKCPLLPLAEVWLTG